jgi:uncharacterized membrane protein YjfL (UPF0719 family)
MNAATIGFVILSVIVLLFLARLLHQMVLGQSVTRMLIEADNRAVAIALGGFLLGVVNVVIPVLGGDSHSFWRDVTGVLTYGLGGIIAMEITGRIFAFYSRSTGLNLRDESLKGNVAAGVVGAAEYIAASQIVSGALTGDSGALIPTIVFWGAGVVALIVLTHLFRYLTSYDDVAEIRGGNVAAAIGYGGLLIAMGTMIGFAVSGEFTGYASGFRGFGLMLVAVLSLYPVRQVIVQVLVLGAGLRLRGGILDREIADDRNLGAGVLEAIGYYATALIVTRVF